MKLGKVVGVCLLILGLALSFISCSLAIEPREEAEAEVVVNPSTPQNVKVAIASRAGDEVTLSVSWDSVDSATGYIIYYQTDEEVFTGERSNIPSVMPQATFTARADEIYLIRVASMVSGKSGSQSAESEPVVVSTINNIDDVSTVLTGNNLRIIIRYPSVVYDGRVLANPKFHVVLTNVETNTVSNDFFLQSPSYDFPQELEPSSSYSLKVEMGFDEDNDKKLDSIISTWESPAPFTTDPDAYPDAIDSVEAQMSDKNSIKVSFKAPPLKHGLDESVQRRFDVVRTQVGSSEEVVVLSHELPMYYDNENSFWLIDDDPTLKPNVKYTYSVTSYYYFTESNAYNRQEEDVATQSNPAHIFSMPINVDAEIEPVENKENTFIETIKFEFPFGFESGDKVVLERRETTFGASGNEWQKVSITDSDLGVSPAVITSTLTTESDANHDYSYRVKVKRGEMESDPGLSTNVVSTNPSATIVKDFTAKGELAGHIVLEWTLAEGVSDEAVSKMTLYRSESSDYSQSTPIASGTDALNGNEYDDRNIVDGKTYYYALAAGTQYSYASAKSLDPVTGVDATKGEYSDRIVVTWQGDEELSIEDYVVFVKGPGDSGFSQVLDSDSEEGITKDPSSGQYSYVFIRDRGTSSAGRTYQFAVKAKDVNGEVSANPPLPEHIAEGNMLGPATIVVDVSEGDYGDSILVKWNAVPGASQYVVKVYLDDGTSNLVSEQRVTASDDMSFTFSVDDVAGLEDIEYALSRSYWFSIFPQFNSEVSDSGTKPVEGYWVKPPMDIVASKAESSEATYLNWSPVENASRYYLYRRERGSLDDWAFVADVLGSSPECTIYDIDSGNRAINPVWEYTVSTVINGVEGPLQNWFVDTDANDGYPDNVGFPLYHPENIRVSELERDGGTSSADYLLKITFQVNPYATGYIISPSVGADMVSIDMEADNISDSVIEDSVVSDGDMYVVGNELTVVMRRPVIRNSVHYSISLSSLNEKISHPTDRQSYGYGMSLTPSKLRLSEVVNLANSVLGDAISKANEYFENDWWANEEWTNNDYYYGPESARQIHAHRKDGGVSYASGESYIDIEKYQIGRVQISGHLGFGIDNSNGWGYLGTEHLNSATSTEVVSVILPPGHGTASISYNGVNASSGSYTVSVIYDDGTSVSGTVNASDVQVSPL